MYNQQIIDFLKEDIKKYESPKRAEHTLGVLNECEYFADKLGLDADERYNVCVAALLHDIAKDIPQKKKIRFCESENIPYSESAVHHQDMGGTLARKLYGSEIVSDAVFSAVSKHTTGSPDMSVCDMILYIADYTESGRKYSECVNMREYVHAECEKINKNDVGARVKFLESVVAKISGDTVAHLKSLGREIDERTYETYVSMLKKIQG